MKKLSFRLLVVVLGCLCGANIQAGDWGPDFSATLVMTNPKNPSQQKTAQLNSSKGRSRLTSSIPARRARQQGMGKTQVEIKNPYKGAWWLIFPDVKKYMERRGEALTTVPAEPMPEDEEHPCKSAKEVVCRKLGNETVGGRAVEKWEIVSEYNGVEERATIWFDIKLGVRVRELVPGKLMQEITNIKVAPQPDSLFELPAGYQKVDPPR